LYQRPSVVSFPKTTLNLGARYPENQNDLSPYRVYAGKDNVVRLSLPADRQPN